MNLNPPRSEKELKNELLAHALDCHECLTVVLFQEDSLAESGCETYRCMFQAATEELERQAPIDFSAHLTEGLIQSFFWERLSDEQMVSMAEHLEGCVECRTLLRNRQDFHLSLKAAVDSRRESSQDEPALAGILELSMPESGLHLSTHINE